MVADDDRRLFKSFLRGVNIGEGGTRDVVHHKFGFSLKNAMVFQFVLVGFPAQRYQEESAHSQLHG